MGNLFEEALHQPATTLLALFLTSIWALIHKYNAGYAEVGMSYNSIVVDQQFWRAASSQISHVEILHLLFNLSALWSLGIIEQSVSTTYFLKQTALLFIFSPLFSLILYHFLIHYARREEFKTVTAVGYSCVLFGWMSFVAVKHPGGITMLPLFGGFGVPLVLTPFCSLIITSLLFPQASFIGHLAGIICGYMIALIPLFDIVPAWAVYVCFIASVGGGVYSFTQNDHTNELYVPASIQSVFPAFSSWFERYHAGNANDVEAQGRLLG